jgi:hypothetical protein
MLSTPEQWLSALPIKPMVRRRSYDPRHGRLLTISSHIRHLLFNYFYRTRRPLVTPRWTATSFLRTFTRLATAASPARVPIILLSLPSNLCHRAWLSRPSKRNWAVRPTPETLAVTFLDSQNQASTDDESRGCAWRNTVHGTLKMKP